MFNSSIIPAVRQEYGATFYYIPYQFGSLIGPEKHWDEEWAFHFFTGNWHHSIWIAVLYSIAVHAGQKAMVDRKPLNLKLPLIFWNAALSIFSLAGTIRMAEELLFVLTTRPLLDSISYAVDPKEPAAFWAGLFAASKLLELGDTAFVVARKKELIFLHWYHHAVVLVYVWHSATELVAGGRWFITMNYAVHALMYAYYALAAAGIRLPRSLSMLITTLQTTQMLIGVFISFAVLHFKLSGRIMQQSYENLLLCFAIYSSFAVLFMNFFRKSYLQKKEKVKSA